MANQPRFAVTLEEAAPKQIGDAVKAHLKPGEFGPHLLCTRFELGLTQG